VDGAVRQLGRELVLGLKDQREGVHSDVRVGSEVVGQPLPQRRHAFVESATDVVPPEQRADLPPGCPEDADDGRRLIGERAAEDCVDDPGQLVAVSADRQLPDVFDREVGSDLVHAPVPGGVGAPGQSHGHLDIYVSV